MIIALAKSAPTFPKIQFIVRPFIISSFQPGHKFVTLLYIAYNLPALLQTH